MISTQTISGRRPLMTELAREAGGGLVDTATAATAWRVSRSVATGRLDRMARSGWVARVRKGLFLVLPLEASGPTTVEDPWVLAARAFAPCYVGGWSAAEHWGLTEQIFQSTFVVSAGAPRSTAVELLGSKFRTVRASAARVASVGSIWRGAVRLAVSDRERTLADGLANPDWVGGLRHLAQMFATYRRSEHWDPGKLIEGLSSLGKGAAYKRLGYLVETSLGGDEKLVSAALAHRSSGVIRLDPQVKPAGKILTRWGLQLNVSLPAEDAS